MNTVGKAGRLGEAIRCVVSVSMLTEGWDTNTVTHILGVRAFGTQLLCEQVVGRALRRQSYEENDRRQLFNVEYADILGIPFSFTAKPVAPTDHRAQARHARPGGQGTGALLKSRFRASRAIASSSPKSGCQAQFTDNSYLVLTPKNVGPCTVLMQGIVGEGVEITPHGAG